MPLWLRVAATAVGSWLAKILIPIMAYFAGVRSGYRKRVQEQNATNAKARKKYEEIEMDDRRKGPWIK